MKYKIYELLGLAASGKSTTIDALKLEDDNFKFYMDDKKVRLIFIKYFYLYLKFYYKTGNLELLKLLIMFHIFLYNLKEEKLSSLDTYIFDQGPIYTISMLIYEAPSMEKIFLEELGKILPYYTEIIYLEAPLDVLCSRINQREQNHRIKNKDEIIQKEFLNKHMSIYNNVLTYCRNGGIEVKRIDTSINSSNQVKKKIDEIIQSR